MTTLINQLTAAYGHSACNATKRYKIDDENHTDCYPGFCRTWVEIPNSDNGQFTLKLDSAPHNGAVVALIKSAGGEIATTLTGATISVPLHTRDATFVRELAKAIRCTTARGQRYPDPNWKWIACRTADALRRFAALLAAANRSAPRAAKENPVGGEEEGFADRGESVDRTYIWK